MPSKQSHFMRSSRMASSLVQLVLPVVADPESASRNALQFFYYEPPRQPVSGGAEPPVLTHDLQPY